MASQKHPKSQGSFQSTKVDLPEAERRKLAALLGIDDWGGHTELWKRLERGLSNAVSCRVNAGKVYLRSDMTAVIRDLATVAREFQKRLADAVTVLGGILDEIWGIDHDFLNAQCELIQKKHNERKAKGSMRGGEKRSYRKIVDTRQKNAQIDFFEHWAKRAGRTNAKYAQDRKKFIGLCRQIVANKLPDENG